MDARKDAAMKFWPYFVSLAATFACSMLAVVSVGAAIVLEVANLAALALVSGLQVRRI